MTLKPTKWRITKITNSARKKIMDLNPDTQTEVIKKLETLTNNPFQHGTKKIEGKQNIYRGRIGDFRYYFRLLNESKSIEILIFDIRGNIKHKKIQNL